MFGTVRDWFVMGEETAYADGRVAGYPCPQAPEAATPSYPQFVPLPVLCRAYGLPRIPGNQGALFTSAHTVDNSVDNVVDTTVTPDAILPFRWSIQLTDQAFHTRHRRRLGWQRGRR